MKNIEKQKGILKKKISHLSTLMEVSEGYPQYNEYSKELDLVVLQLHDVLKLNIAKMEKKEVKKVTDIEPISGARVEKKPVNSYDLQGHYLKTYDSMSEAAKELALSWTAVSRACKGKQKRAGNYQFRFAE
jgi:hypothetical protein